MHLATEPTWGERSLATIIIAAHNEAAVMRRCLDSFLTDAVPGEFEVIVAANGCADDTAAIARSFTDVMVIELPVGNKVSALNAAERFATQFPRVYLDADVVLDTGSLRLLCARVRQRSTGIPSGEHVSIMASSTIRRLDTAGRPWVVRAYSQISGRHPAFGCSLFGRGVIALSAEGRGRFGEFPAFLADDLFLDSIFTEAEKTVVSDAVSVVATPRRTRDLVERLVRVRRANTQLRGVLRDASHEDGKKQPVARGVDRGGWLFDLVRHQPSLVPAAVTYVLITLIAELRSRFDRDSSSWGFDGSTRVVAADG